MPGRDPTCNEGMSNAINNELGRRQLADRHVIAGKLGPWTSEPVNRKLVRDLRKRGYRVVDRRRSHVRSTTNVRSPLLADMHFVDRR